MDKIKVAKVSFEENGREYYFSTNNLNLKKNLTVIVETERGLQFGYVKDILEKDINLKIVLKLEEELVSKGAIVYLTRREDKDLATPNSYYRKKSDLGNRAELINNSDADFFISIG